LRISLRTPRRSGVGDAADAMAAAGTALRGTGASSIAPSARRAAADAPPLLRRLGAAVAVAALAGLAAAKPGAAQMAAPGTGLALPESEAAAAGRRGWSLSLGVVTLAQPEFPGSDSLRVLPLPDFDLRYGDIAFLSLRDGAGLALLRWGGLSFGPIARLRFPRDQDSNAKALHGLGDVDATLELGGFLRYEARPFRLFAELRQGVNGGGHGGLVLDLGADWSGRLAPSWAFSVGPRASFGNARFARAYFGVSESQALRSGYAAFSPGGYASLGAAGSLQYRVTERWTAAAFLDLRWLVGEVADSPIVRGPYGSDFQATIGLAISYRFGF